MNLIIVDCQYDFCNPKGTLYVPGAIQAIKNIANLVKTRGFSKIILTADWHSPQDLSFDIHGGKWPKHCVQYSKGAAIVDILLKALADSPNNYEVICKGVCPDIEEYGAFYDSGPLPDGGLLLESSGGKCTMTNREFVVCGVAGDYCVKETLQNLMPYRPLVYTKGIASIDGGTTLKEFIKEHNLREYDY